MLYHRGFADMMIAAYAARRMRVAILSAEKKTNTNMRRAVLIIGYQKLKRRMEHDRTNDDYKKYEK